MGNAKFHRQAIYLIQPALLEISLMPEDSIRPVHAQFPAHGRAPFRAHCCPSAKVVD